MTPKIEKLMQRMAELKRLETDLKNLITAELRALTADDVLGEDISPKPRTVRAASVPANKTKGTQVHPCEAAAPKAERKPRADGLPAKILAEINANPAMIYTADDLIETLKVDPDKAQQVRTTLSRMLKQEKIASEEKGQYRAKKLA